MREPRAIEVAFVVHEDLGLVDEAAERGGVDHAVAVALELRAERWRVFEEASAPRRRRLGGVRGELEGRHAHSSSAASTVRSSERSGAGITTARPSFSIKMSFSPFLS